MWPLDHGDAAAGPGDESARPRGRGRSGPAYASLCPDRASRCQGTEGQGRAFRWVRRIGYIVLGMKRICTTLAGVVVLAVAAGCSAAAPKPVATPKSPAGQAPDATACGPVAASYPGWPGSGSATLTTDLIPVLGSTQLSIGPNRFLYTLINKANQPLAAADVTTSLRFFDLQKDPATAVASADGIFLDATQGRGLYHAPVTFPCSGMWGAEVTAQLGEEAASARVVFPVQPTSTTPAIGAAAPQVDTPTATTAAGIAAISTDTTPDPDFYRMSIAQAVTAGKPALIVFATPAFCKSATCGPALNVVKGVAADYKSSVDFVHVEPYILQQTPNGLQPVLDKTGNLQTVQATNTYGLLTEPYIIVVDKTGKVAAEFEGIAGADELTAALDAVTKG